MAAQARVYSTEASSSGGLRVARRLRLVQRARLDSEHIVRMVRWGDWFDAASVAVLTETVTCLERRGCGPRSAELALSQESPRPWTLALCKQVRSQLQRWIYTELERSPPGWATERIRHKLARWRLPGYPRRTATSVLQALLGLSTCVPPRVHVAVLRTLFNGWVTQRRFQRDAAGFCRFRCGGNDAIEHYLRCPVVHDFARRRLRLDIPMDSRWPVMLFECVPPNLIGQSSLPTRLALLHYCIYRAVNMIRHNSGLPLAELPHLLGQALTEGVRGHKQATQVLSQLWR